MNIVRRISKIVSSAPSDLKRRLIVLSSVLAVVNVGIWLLALIASRSHPLLLGLVALSYGFGLRHAVDADHIAAIDNTTRKLMHEGGRPVAVGFFFSLGHSIIVIALSGLVAISASFVKHSLPAWQAAGSLIGTCVSIIFLMAIGAINLVTLIQAVKIWRKVVVHKAELDPLALEEHMNNKGFMSRVLKPLLKVVTKSWNMFFIGFLFGLGFDTASEIGLLSISAATAASGISIASILLLPLAFTAGMTLIDSLDGVLMLGAYGWAYLKPVRKLYYNMNITFISVLTALFIGGIEALQLFSQRFNIDTGIFALANHIHLENFGLIIIFTFLISWLASMAFYRFKRYDMLDSAGKR